MKIFVWGTGRLVGKVIGKYIDIEKVEAFVDNDKEKKEYMGKRVFTPEELLDMEYDAILVINLYSIEIKAQCEKIGLDLAKIIFIYNNCILQDINQNYELAKKVFGEEYSKTIRERYHIIRGVEAYGNLCFTNEKIGGGV